MKRIVFTSSASSVESYPSPPGTIYTENNWNEGCIQLLEADKTGKEKLSYRFFYPVSKTVAEKGMYPSTPLFRSTVDPDNQVHGSSTRNTSRKSSGI